MTEAPNCERCGNRIHDTAYVCARCADWLRADLEFVAKLAGEAMVTIARLDRIERTGATEHVEEDRTCGCPQCTSDDEPDSALYPTPWPVNLRAGAQHDAAVGELTTWVRHITETRGLPGPTTDGQHPLSAATLWLTGHLDWLRHRPEAAEAYDALVAACRSIIGVVDRAPERVIVGRCPCQVVREDGQTRTEYLYAVRGQPRVTCRSCGTSYDVDSTRDDLRRRLDEALFTAAEAAALVTYFGLVQSRDTTRKLINKWRERGLLVAYVVRGREDTEGDDAERDLVHFRFGEIVSRLGTSRRAS